MTYPSLAALSVTLVLITSRIDCNKSSEIGSDSHLEGNKLCEQRSGHRYNFIQEIRWRNNKCTIDCVMTQGVVLSYHAKDGTSCSSKGYQCVLGTCRTPGEYVIPEKMVNNVQIKIISANVEDQDISPTAGESDVFIMIEMAKGGLPTYKDNDDICFTYIIQDNNSPKWENFVCKLISLPLNSVLRFSAFDSDKPFSKSDFLGSASVSLSYLLNTGPHKLALNELKANGQDIPYYVEVEVKGTASN